MHLSTSEKDRSGLGRHFNHRHRRPVANHDHPARARGAGRLRPCRKRCPRARKAHAVAAGLKIWAGCREQYPKSRKAHTRPAELHLTRAEPACDAERECLMSGTIVPDVAKAFENKNEI